MATNDISFKYTKQANAFVSGGKANEYAGAFVKIGAYCTSVQPCNRRILLPHIGYPSDEGPHAIAIQTSVGNDMGTFAWAFFDVFKFEDDLDFVYINGSTKNTSWYPTNSESYNILHGRLYNITGHPFDYYINGMRGKASDTDILLQHTATTIYPNASLNYINDVPVLHANDKRIWVSDVASHLETKGNSSASIIRDNRSMYEMDGDSSYTYPTVSSMLNVHDSSRLIGYETFEDAKVILIGYLDDKHDICDHLASPYSFCIDNMNREFLSLRVMRGFLQCDYNRGSDIFSMAHPEEIDRVDDAHIELIDGMWMSLSTPGMNALSVQLLQTPPEQDYTTTSLGSLEYSSDLAILATCGIENAPAQGTGTNRCEGYSVWRPRLGEFEIPKYTFKFQNITSSYTSERRMCSDNRSDREFFPDGYGEQFDYLNDPVYQFPYWDSKEAYDALEKPSGYKAIKYWKNTKSNIARDCCFWCVNENIAYPAEWNFMSFRDANWFPDGITSPDQTVIINECPKCSLFTPEYSDVDLDVRSLSYIDVGSGAADLYGGNTTTIFHWHCVFSWVNEDGTFAYAGGDDDGYATYGMCSRGCLSMFAKTSDIEAMRNAKTHDGEQILTDVDPRYYDILLGPAGPIRTSQSSVNGWSIVMYTLNLSNKVVKEYINKLTSTSVAERRARIFGTADVPTQYQFFIWVENGDKYDEFNVTFDVDDSEYQQAIYISKETDPYDANYSKYSGSFQYGYTPSKAYWTPTDDAIYVPECDLKLVSPRKFHKYNPVNLIEFSGIKFRRYAK